MTSQNNQTETANLKATLRKEFAENYTAVTVITRTKEITTILPKTHVQDHIRKAVKAGHVARHKGVTFEKESLYIDIEGITAEEAKLFRYIEEKTFVIITDEKNKTETICDSATFKPIPDGKFSIGGQPIPPIKSTETAIVPVRSN